jgi:hypothetical protein
MVRGALTEGVETFTILGLQPPRPSAQRAVGEALVPQYLLMGGGAQWTTETTQVG